MSDEGSEDTLNNTNRERAVDQNHRLVDSLYRHFS